MFKIVEKSEKCIFGPVKHEKFLQCLHVKIGGPVACFDLLVFTRGEFWPSGIVVAFFCLSVCLSTLSVSGW